MHALLGFAEESVKPTIALSQTRDADDDVVTLVEERLEQCCMPLASTCHPTIMTCPFDHTQTSP